MCHKLQNIGELLKPTIPKLFIEHGPQEEKGFFKCTRCDLCKHVPANTKSFKSPWDGRKWKLKKHITCQSENVVYLIVCTLHDNCWYIGSTDNVRRRWTRHKYDWKHGNRTCMLASNGQDVPHPGDPELQYLTILPIDTGKRERYLWKQEVWWQDNVSVHYFYLNKRRDICIAKGQARGHSALKTEKIVQNIKCI